MASCVDEWFWRSKAEDCGYIVEDGVKVLVEGAGKGRYHMWSCSDPAHPVFQCIRLIERVLETDGRAPTSLKDQPSDAAGGAQITPRDGSRASWIERQSFRRMGMCAHESGVLARCAATSERKCSGECAG